MWAFILCNVLFNHWYFKNGCRCKTSALCVFELLMIWDLTRLLCCRRLLCVSIFNSDIYTESEISQQQREGRIATQTRFKRFCRINFKVIFILLCNAMVVQYAQYLFCNISEWLETFCGKCSRVQNDKQTMPNSCKVTFVIDVWHQPRQSRLRWRSGPQILQRKSDRTSSTAIHTGRHVTLKTPQMPSGSSVKMKICYYSSFKQLLEWIK